MKILKDYQYSIIFIFTLIFNFLIFIINYLNYDSTRGTDFVKYRPHLDYYLYGLENGLEEQGVGYYWVISQFSKIKINSLKYSIEYEPLLVNFGIQFGNFMFYAIGCAGIYKLLRYFKTSSIHSLLIINLVAVFPPILGARMILKPEIMAFAYLPWCIYIIYKFLDENNFKLLFLIVPPISILVSAKASISLMVALSLLIFLQKDFLSKKIIPILILALSIFLLLVVESENINNKYVWETALNSENYDYVAPLDFLVSINSELISNPYRDSQASSMIGIILLDTFGDYWQRYWYHKDAWLNNQYPGNLINTRVGIFLSSIFYFYLIVSIFKDRDNKFKKLGLLSFVGIVTLLINIYNIFPFLTKNFDPYKGDPIKTHYFSFLLVFSFIYMLAKAFRNDKKFLVYPFLVFVFLFSFNIQKSISIEEIKTNQTVLNKLHILSPCLLNDPIRKIIDYSGGWCNEAQYSLKICEGEYNADLSPYIENDYYIYPPDEIYNSRNLILDDSTVTVANYYECLSYVKSGYISQNANLYFFNSTKQLPYIFFIAFIFSNLSIIYLVTFLRNK